MWTHDTSLLQPRSIHRSDEVPYPQPLNHLLKMNHLSPLPFSILIIRHRLFFFFMINVTLPSLVLGLFGVILPRSRPRVLLQLLRGGVA